MFLCIFKTRVKYGFHQNLPEGGTVNSMERKTRVFCQNDVQEFHLCMQRPLQETMAQKHVSFSSPKI